ncbi:glycosyltransferase family 87 protein [Halobacteriaceae archaeon SHR40]|uniref:glycosyltransferase family 87 protein n=1 Tax=Halovenus amylolytica TaxID=2500550 RepID=UPI000FE4170D
MRLPFSARPLVRNWNLGAWLVLLATLPLGFYSYYQNSRIGLSSWNPGGTMGVNYRTYHYAAERALAGQSFYDVTPPGTYDWAVYLYPPGTLPTFYPFTLFEWTTGYAILTVLSVLGAGLATWLLVGYVESLGPELGWIDVGLVFGAVLFSTHTYGTIYYGNINILLALGLLGGFVALQRDREYLAGSVFALTALFKVFPALIGFYLLRVRRWYAVGAALLTGLGGLVVGVVLYGLDATVYYFTDVVAGRTETELFTGGYPIEGIFYITIQRPISRLVSAVWPSAPYLVIFGVSVLICASILAYFYYDLGTELDRQMAIFATLVVMLILVPSLQWYLVLLYFPLVTLLYLWQDGASRYLFLIGGVLFSVTGNTADTVDALERAPDVVETLGYPIAVAATPPLYGLLLMLAACAIYKYRSRETETQPVFSRG